MNDYGLGEHIYSTLTELEKKKVILEYLKEQACYIPTIIITKDVSERHNINPREIPDLLEYMAEEGLIDVNPGFLGYNKRWAFSS